ncbi:hypothetical protein ORI20_09005 [Mycobacterium sp. CVI_P3]|uniref:Uncharacterized protein n=1 Tax=Mycobacterium pinniadriaticum TaxID=2994102 RepID=A0ABT3SBF7_9MYCO|nr:hypothetical protein [Mycobacterium pinniadriaticum]MCX2930412.1 hypothetical protein [Mycobacterium pinniadriaticum]MCX2936836.1 hypothetical protein [Mycobacterium pinniadriaticum]
MADDEINRITQQNAMRPYSFDMFSHIPAEQLTVGALRAQATDVDLGVRFLGTAEKDRYR